MSWINDEKQERPCSAELMRLLQRAVRRPLLTFVVAALITLGSFAAQARRQTVFSAQADVLLTESALSSEKRRLTRAELKGFVERVAFSSQRLSDLMKQHSLFQAEAARSPTLALNEMRRSIEVDINEDYFAEYRFERSPRRSARIVITYRAEHPELAAVVVRELGLLVARAELSLNAQRARQQARLADSEAAGVQSEAARIRQELNELNTAVAAHHGRVSAEQQVRSRRLTFELAQVEKHAGELESGRVSLHLAAAAEGKEAGTRVHVAEYQPTGAAFENRERRWRRRVGTSVVVGLGLAVALVGAFNPRLYDADDIIRAGGCPLGRMRASQSPIRSNAEDPWS